MMSLCAQSVSALFRPGLLEPGLLISANPDLQRRHASNGACSCRQLSADQPYQWNTEELPLHSVVTAAEAG